MAEIPASPSYLDIALLGYPEVRLNAQHVTNFPTKKSQALLFYLAVKQKPCSREELAALLWPAAEARRGRKNLRDTLSHLRKILDQFILSDAETIAFDTKSSYTLDVDLFQAHFTTTNVGTNMQVLPGERRTIANLYRGEFLQGFSVRGAPAFDDWVSTQRERLHQHAIRVMCALIPYTIDHGPFEDGIALCNQILLLEPWNEDAQAALIQLLNQSGQRNAAINQYQAFTKLLNYEFDGQPSPELQQLYEEILSGGGQEPSADAGLGLEQRATAPKNSYEPQHLPPKSAERVEQGQSGGLTERRLDSVSRRIPNNIPMHSVAFVGRKRELREIYEAIHDIGCRLLTLTGLGGMGKTKLAMEFALLALEEEEALSTGDSPTPFSDGIYFVALNMVTSPSSEPHHGSQRGPTNELQAHSLTLAILDTLGLRPFGKVDIAEHLNAALRGKKILLILDNFEHLLDGRMVLPSLLEQAPELRIIVTSRQRLSLPQEKVLKVNGLSLNTYEAGPAISDGESPKPIARISDAMRLFRLRSRVSTAEMSTTTNTGTADGAIQKICQLVDGMPLAIELAASLSHTVPIESIPSLLAEDYSVLNTNLNGIKPEHKNIDKMLDASWQKLSQPEQKSLARLSIFRSEFTAEQGKAVTDTTDDILASVVDKSFLTLVNGRYEMQALIHRKANAELHQKPNERVFAEKRYKQYFFELLETRITDWRTSHDRGHLESLDSEYHNLLALQELTLASGEATRISLIVEYLWVFYKSTIRLSNAQKLLNDALQLAEDHPFLWQPGDVAQWLFYLSDTYFDLGQVDTSDGYAWQALAKLGYSQPRNEMHYRFLLIAQIGKQIRWRIGQAKPDLQLEDKKDGTIEPNERNNELDALKCTEVAARTYSRLQYNSYIRNDSLGLLYHGLSFSNLAEQIPESTALSMAYGQMALLTSMFRMTRQSESYKLLANKPRGDIGQNHDLATKDLCIGLSAISIGEWEDAESHLMSAYDFWTQVGDWSDIGDCIGLLNSLAVKLGDLHRSREYGLELEQLAAISHNTSHYAWAKLIQAVSLTYLGRTEEACSQLVEALEHVDKLTFRDIGYATGYSTAALAHFHLGLTEEALRYADKVLEAWAEKIPTSIVHLYCFDCLLTVYSGIWEISRQELAQPNLARMAPIKRGGLRRNPLAATANHYRRTTARVIRQLVRFGWHHPTAAPYIHFYRGRYLWGTGSLRQAVNQWKKGLDSATRYAQPPLLARFEYELGRHLEKGAPERLARLQTAYDLYSELDMHYDRQLVEQELDVSTYAEPDASVHRT